MNNGLMTKIWGPALWTGLHSIAFGYPIEPTDEHKKKYRIFFEILGEVLPCIHCRNSYNSFITENEDTKLTDDDFLNRDKITHWIYRLHNKVNEKLGYNYGITYESVCKKYESYRAKCNPKDNGCNVALDHKKCAFKNNMICDCPIITFEEASRYHLLAKKKLKKDKYFEFYNFIKTYNGNIEKSKENEEMWKKRNIICRQIIDHMRCNNIPKEVNGELTDLFLMLTIHLSVL